MPLLAARAGRAPAQHVAAWAAAVLRGPAAVEEYEPPDAEDVFRDTLEVAEKRRGSNIKVLRSSEYSVMKPLCKYMVIATFKYRIPMLFACRHVKQKADARNVRVWKAKSGIEGNPVRWRRPHVEAEQSDRWMLVDLGSVVFHAFSPEGRQYYDLDGHWEEAQKAFVEEGISHEEFLRRKQYEYRA